MIFGEEKEAENVYGCLGKKKMVLPDIGGR